MERGIVAILIETACYTFADNSLLKSIGTAEVMDANIMSSMHEITAMLLLLLYILC